MNEQFTLSQLAGMMKALGHPLRLRILNIFLINRLSSIPTLQKDLTDVDAFTLYRNLRYMEKKMLLKKLRKGREIYYGITEKTLGAGFETFFQIRSDGLNPDGQTNKLRYPVRESVQAIGR